MKYWFWVIVFFLFSISNIFAVQTQTVGSGSWDESTTWDNGVPMLGDDVTVHSGHEVDINISADFGTLINDGIINWSIGDMNGSSVTNNGTINILPGSHTIYSNLDNTSSSNFNISSGASLTLPAGLTITQFGSSTLDGDLNLEGGNITTDQMNAFSGSGTINVNSSSTLDTPMPGDIWSPIIGIINLNENLNGNHALTVDASTTVNVNTGGNFSGQTITNNGTINILTGSLTLNSDLNNTSSFNINSVASLTFSSGTNITQTGSFTVDGTLNINAATLTQTGSFTINGTLNIDGATLTQTGSFTINGTLNIDDANISITDANSFSGTGTININSNSIIDASTGDWSPTIVTINLKAELSGNHSLTVNSGTILNLHSGGNFSPNPTTNHGIINILTGLHTLSSGITNTSTSTCDISSGANLTLSADFIVDGTLNINGATITINTTNALSGSGEINVNNNSTINSNAGGIWAPTIPTINLNANMNGNHSLTVDANTTVKVYAGGNFSPHPIINNGTINILAGSHTLNSDLDNAPGSDLTISLGASLSLSGGTNITQAGSFTVDGTLNINGANVTINEAGSISGAGTIKINNNSTIKYKCLQQWGVGTIDWLHQSFMQISMGIHALTVKSLTTVNIYEDGNFSAQAVVNDGIINILEGSHTLNSGINNTSISSFIIDPGASFTLPAVSITQAGSFTVHGSLNINGATIEIIAADVFSGAGTININSNSTINTPNSGDSWSPVIVTLNLYAELNGNHALTINTGTTLNWHLNGNLLTGQPITNFGSIILIAGDHTFNANLDNKVGSSFTINSVASLILTGMLMTQSGSFTVNGTLHINDAIITINQTANSFSGTGTININNNSIINTPNPGDSWSPMISVINLNAELSGNHALTISAGTTVNWHMDGNFLMIHAITNFGTIEILAGAHSLNSHLDNKVGSNFTISGGSLTIPEGIVMTQSGNLTQSGDMTVDGTFNINGATITINNNASSFSGVGTININNNSTINSYVGPAEWTPVIDSINIYANLGGNHSLTVNIITLVNIYQNGNLSMSPTLINYGVINILAGSHTLNPNLENKSFSNFNISSGATLTFPGTINVTQSGNFTVNGMLNINGTFIIIEEANSFSGTGTININNSSTINSNTGGQDWLPTVGVINLYANLNGAYKLTVNSSTTINCHANGNFITTFLITNNGTINILAGSHTFNTDLDNKSGAGFTISTGASITLPVSVSIIQSGSFTVNGTLNINGAGITLNQANSFSGAGTININNDSSIGGGWSPVIPAINIAGNATLTGTGILIIHSTTTFIIASSGELNFSSQVKNNGLIKGNGVVTSPTIDNYGTISPGASPGSMIFNGSLYNYNILEMEINTNMGVVSFDSIHINGGLFLGGSTLKVIENGNTPSNTSYTIITTDMTGISAEFETVILPDCFTVEYFEGAITLSKGVVKIWDGTVNNWNQPTHWNPDGVPCPLDHVFINSGECLLNIQPDMKSLTINGGKLKKINASTYAINVKTTVAAAGTINVFAGTLDFNDTLDNNGLIQGFGIIELTPPATVIGGYGKWGPGNSTGTLDQTGTFNNEVIEMEIGGNGGGIGTVELDKLNVSQTMVSGGDLIIPWLGGTIPPGIRTLMECSGGSGCRTGTFNNITFPPQCPPGKCNIIYTPTEVQLENTEPIEFTGTCTWLGGVGNWATVNNWSCNDVPNENDDVVINSGTITLDKAVTVKSLNLAGGSIQGNNNLTVSNSFQWSGGSYSAGSNLMVGNATLSGSISLSNTNMILSQGGTFNNPTLNLINNASITLSSGKILTLDNQGTLNNDNAQNFVNNGTIMKSGPGVFTFKNPFVNNGITNISGGILKFNNNFSSTGLLKGNGTIDLNNAGNVLIGLINPGSSPGTFNIIGNMVNKHYLAEFLTSAGITTHDHIIVSNNIQLQDSLTIIKLAGEDIPYGTYTIMHCNGPIPCITGNFVTVSYPSFCNGADCNLLITGADVKFVFQAPLPVELEYFTGRLLNKEVQLNWTTLSEQNAEKFDVMRSANGSEWVNIGEVAANGTTSYKHDYSFIDDEPISGDNYYRLKQYDLDNTTYYSKVITVQTPILRAWKLFPNPVQDLLEVKFTEKEDGIIRIFDATGRMVMKKLVESEKSISIDLSSLSNGLYWVQLNGYGTETIFKK